MEGGEGSCHEAVCQTHGAAFPRHKEPKLIAQKDNNNDNNIHLSCAHQRPERSHDTY